MLYKTFENALPSEGTDPTIDNPVEPFGVKDLFTALGTFLGVSVGSVIIGVSVALGCCFIFKKIDFSTMPVYEFTLVTLFAYSSYFLAEIAYLSGIMSLFFCSICLAHYNYYNIVSLQYTHGEASGLPLATGVVTERSSNWCICFFSILQSTNAQISTQGAFKSVAQICETFVFAYIGITAGLSIYTSHLKWSFAMIVLSIICCLIARAANVFPLCAMANLKRTGSQRIPFKMQSQWSKECIC